MVAVSAAVTIFAAPTPMDEVQAMILRRSETDYHAVTEDREHAVYEGFLFAVHLDILLVQELDNRLTNCHSGFAHCFFLLKNALIPYRFCGVFI